MKRAAGKRGFVAFGRACWAALLALWVGVAAAQTPYVGLEPLTQDRGRAALAEQFRKLHTTARLVHTTAHPDDEDGAMLTLSARGQGARTTLVTLTRGEGGQNATGGQFYDALGGVRTLELLASDRYYGVEQRFSRLADFGFSRTAAESMEKWGGHDAALGEMVRLIRTLRPDVLVSRWQGNEADGHGHHQAAGQLTIEAFRAAGDAKKFPEQFAEGLYPWQALKLYVELPASEKEQATLILDESVKDETIGATPAEFAREGLRFQASQGMGSLGAPARESYFKLADSLLTNYAGYGEKSFFDGIDFSVKGMGSMLGGESRNTPWLSERLNEIQTLIDEAEKDSGSDATKAVEPLLLAARLTEEAQAWITGSAINMATSREVAARLGEKHGQLLEAARLASGMELEARLERTSTEALAGFITPGEALRLTIKWRHADALKLNLTGLRVVGGDSARWTAGALEHDPGDGPEVLGHLRVTTPENAEYTRPVMTRSDPARQTVYHVDKGGEYGAPLPPAPLSIELEYRLNNLLGSTRAAAAEEYTAADQKKLRRPLMVAPALSVSFERPVRLLASERLQPIELHVRVRALAAGARDGVLTLRSAPEYEIEPTTQPINLAERGDEHTFKFYLLPRDRKPGEYPMRAIAKLDVGDYEQGVDVVGRPEIGATGSFQPSTLKVAAIDVKTPENQHVGYIDGAGDGVAAALEDLDVDVQHLSDEDLATAKLNKYAAIVVGVRAYDVRAGLRANNARLLEYVKQGGVLIVQYNSALEQFNAGHFAPYNLTLGRDRVTVEQAPVKLLENNAPVMRTPNRITAADFNGWAQERGLYYPERWDGKYKPLFEAHDPGQKSLEGGVLTANYGKGVYVYTSVAFFRQLPNGVSGATRLFINLLFAPGQGRSAQ